MTEQTEKQYRATKALFAGRVRAANAGDIVPASAVEKYDWKDVEAVEVDEAGQVAEWNLDTMTGEQLKEFAKTREIDLGGATKVEDIRAVVKAGGAKPQS